MSKRTDLHSPEAQAKRDRTATAEAKVKRLRVENDDLRRQLFRAQEATRLADEEALALRQSLASVKRSREAAVAECAKLRDQVERWAPAPEASPTLPQSPGLVERITAAFARKPA